MTLKLYKEKRNFTQTPEPRPSKGEKATTSLHFFVQKHAARRLHYDFRLELDGVLLSWAIPKGPSMNPGEKRLAIKVEDHPLDYGTFEGEIPKGNYGAGTVLLWDKGNYTTYDAKTKKENEQKLHEGLAKGHLDLNLNGKKLKGKFALIQLKNANKENAWLLIKGQDDYSSKEDITLKDYSVKKQKPKQQNPL